ncbi:hypothetical protein QQF64_003682 [Cirrhinus molitorella]|uniref:Uncharacterized protein n=1 Tax=Cirrhinus molitorella TaxID=172907 RepID=A0ABR3MLZ5_9TELE
MSVFGQTAACDSLQRQRLEEPCVPVTESPYENKHSPGEAQKQLQTELRSTNTDIREKNSQVNHSRTGKLNISAFGIQKESSPALLTAHNMMAHICFMLHRADRAGGSEGMKRLTANILLLYQRRENTQRAADRPPPVQTGVATGYWNPPKASSALSKYYNYM